MIMQYLYINFLTNCQNYFGCDAPLPGQKYLSDPASIAMTGIIEFNQHLTFVIIGIVLFVAWILGDILTNFVEFDNPKSATEFVHNSNLEIVWTTIPALILLSLASPSFSLLYSMDEISSPDLSLKILGHQWFWSYEISDFSSCQTKKKNIKYTCYLMMLDGLPKNNVGYFRLLETNRRVILPSNTHLRLLVSAADVLHSWTIPSFGIKVDACPGRLNQVNLFIKRVGIFFGQCSEICGVNHGFMPIVVIAMSTSQYRIYVVNKLQFLNV